MRNTNASSSPTLKGVSSNGIIINGNVLFVPAAGTDLENGALLLTVKNEITGLGTASATNRHLIRLDAGTYDLGSVHLGMQSYVDIEGSGEGTTLITSTHSSNSTFSSATLLGASNSEIRFLIVENRGGAGQSVGIYITSSSPSVVNVTVTAFGGSTAVIGVYSDFSSSPTLRNVTVTTTDSGGSSWGVVNSNSSPSMTNLTITASGGSTQNYGVYNAFGSSPTMANVTATGTGGSTGLGVFNEDGSSPTIRHCSFTGATHSIRNDASSARVASTRLEGAVDGSGFTCVGVYDVSFAALGAGCL